MAQESNEPQAGSREKDSRDKSAGFQFKELELSMEQMLKNGVHFGHKKSRLNPKMKQFIFPVKGNISIIDVEKSIPFFEKALEYVRMVAANGGKILFVGTKPQAREIVKSIAETVEMPHITNRWLGGTFTNFPEIKKRIKYLNEQESKLTRGELEKYTKYEQSVFKKEIEKMNEKMGGIKKMESLPQAVFVADVNEDKLAAKEARAAKIPVIGIVDTNSDPDTVDHLIPGNDDALSSIRYITGLVAKNIVEAKMAAKAAQTQKKESEKNNGPEKNNPEKKI
jgi:small subunit ribosomal protein S2